MRSTLVILVILGAALFVGDVSPTGAGAPAEDEATLTIRVIHDLNENGVWDEGEPGLEGWEANGLCGDVWEWDDTTGGDGTFTIPRQTPGLDCVNFDVEFGWFALTPTRVIVSYDPGDEVEVVLLARKVGDDVAFFSGRLVEDGLPAPADAELLAWVDGQPCGDVQVDPQLGITHYSLYVLGTAEMPSCAEEGNNVSFTISSAGAGSASFASGEREYRDIIAGPSPMYFSYSSFQELPGEGLVTPRIGSRECGESFLIDAFGLVPPNWQEVYIPAAESLPGCGAVDAVVSLWSGDQVVEQVMWESGLVQQFSVRHFGDADCDGEADSVDAAVVLQSAAGLLKRVACEAAGDTNQNGALDAVDAALLLQRAAELIEWFPAA